MPRDIQGLIIHVINTEFLLVLKNVSFIICGGFLSLNYVQTRSNKTEHVEHLLYISD